jgi:hypothetical protein
MISREELKQDLNQLLIDKENIQAVWEGGSVATGFMDAFSDLDLSIIVKEGYEEETFKCLETFLDHTYGILNRFRMPEPTWHGFSQAFYQIKQVSPWLYLDVCIIRETLPDKFTESDRHGVAHIWFDKKGIYHPTIQSQATLEARCQKYYRLATQTDWLMEIELRKNIERGILTEAYHQLYSFTVRNLGILLNLKHRPEKVDFQLRYAYRDFPKPDLDLIESVFKASSIEEYRLVMEKVLNRYYQLKSELIKLWGM